MPVTLLSTLLLLIELILTRERKLLLAYCLFYIFRYVYKNSILFTIQIILLILDIRKHTRAHTQHT